MFELGTGPVRNRSAIGKFVLLLSLGLVSACASFQGQPDPVIHPNHQNLSMERVFGSINTTVSAVYNSPDDADRCIAIGSGEPRCGLTKEEYRNYVIGAYLAAANDRYSEFTRRLRLESRGSSVALDVGALGFATGATLASERTANVFAAIVAGLTGTRQVLGREVYLEQTIPALIGAMDAARTRLRATILAGLRNTADEYPLEMAWSDVQEYESLASLDGAVQALTEDAAERVDSANAFAEDVRAYTGPAESGVRDIRTRIRERLFALSSANDRDTLIAIANDVGITVPTDATANEIRRLLQRRVQETLGRAETEDLARKIGVNIGG